MRSLDDVNRSCTVARLCMHRQHFSSSKHHVTCARGTWISTRVVTKSREIGQVIFPSLSGACNVLENATTAITFHACPFNRVTASHSSAWKLPCRAASPRTRGTEQGLPSGWWKTRTRTARDRLRWNPVVAVVATEPSIRVSVYPFATLTRASRSPFGNR